MAQAYEYLTVTSGTDTTFTATLATNDADGWEVIGYGFNSEGSSLVHSALLRRRV